MWRSCRLQLLPYLLSVMVIGMVVVSPLEGQQNDQRSEQIGEVLGKPVFRDEIRTGRNVELRAELYRLFTAAVMQEYRQTHKAEITPTESEIAAATAFFDKQHHERIQGQELALRGRLESVEERLAGAELTKEERRELEIERLTVQSQLKPPGRFFADFVLRNWKFQRHLYEEYGGGRILWQQAGLEAFDATHKWLESQEKTGTFKIIDPKLRTVFYEYWTTQNHGPFLTADKDRIRREFLEPEWMPKSSPRN